MPAEGDLNPTTKSKVDPNFEDQINNFVDKQNAYFEKVSKTEESVWLTPDKKDWSGDLTDNKGVGDAFNRDVANEVYVEAIKDTNSPGVVNDLQVATVQVAHLSNQERAYRARHFMPRTRCLALALGRVKAHGNQKGSLKVVALEYVRDLVKRAGS